MSNLLREGSISVGSDVPAYLPALLADRRITLDHIKIGLWQGIEGARRELAALPPALRALPVLLHGDNQAAGQGPIPAQELRALADLVEQTRTPWFSVHIEYRTPAELEAFRAGGLPLTRGQAVERIAARVEQLKQALAVPVLLENVPPCPADAPDMVADPEFIAEVLVEADCDMLLDLSHARLSGDRFGLPYEDYLLRLPLGRVVEVHVSGPRVGRHRRAIWGGPFSGHRRRVLWDAHEPMRKPDYDLLGWLLQRHRPRAITLEYWKDPACHAAQLNRLRRMLQFR
jgi:uncharacterized protein (UPF0276 family)